MDIQEITIESHIDLKKLDQSKYVWSTWLITHYRMRVCALVWILLISYSSSCVVAHIENIHTLEKLLDYNIMD